jgi:hypothetical protein
MKERLALQPRRGWILIKAQGKRSAALGRRRTKKPNPKVVPQTRPVEARGQACRTPSGFGGRFAPTVTQGGAALRAGLPWAVLSNPFGVPAKRGFSLSLDR